MAVYLAKAGQGAEAGAMVVRAMDLAPTDLQVTYRAAVTRVLLGQNEEGIDLLKRAVAAGYSRTAIRDDEDFDSIRASVAFRELMGAPEGKP